MQNTDIAHFVASTNMEIPLAEPQLPTLPAAPRKMQTGHLNAYFGKTQALREVSLDVPEHRVLARKSVV